MHGPTAQSQRVIIHSTDSARGCAAATWERQHGAYFGPQARRPTSARVRRRRTIVVAVGSGCGDRRDRRHGQLHRTETAGRGCLARGVAYHGPPHRRPRRRRLTPAEALLATTDDPAACAVSFAGDGIVDAPMLQTQGALYTGLPIPSRDGLVFAGWYATPADAASFAIPGRVNGADLVACADQRGDLSPVVEVARRERRGERADPHPHVPPVHDEARGRGRLAARELRVHRRLRRAYEPHRHDRLLSADVGRTGAFIDGRLFLPNHSVIVTDDDADQTWFDLAAPVVDKHKVLTTSFMITAYRQDPPPNAYVLRRSHTHDMHQAGANGDGRIVNLTVPRSSRTWRRPSQVLGVKEIMAYPFGHYNDTVEGGPATGGLGDGADDRARLREHRHRQARAADRAHQLRDGPGRPRPPDRLTAGRRMPKPAEGLRSTAPKRVVSTRISSGESLAL